MNKKITLFAWLCAIALLSSSCGIVKLEKRTSQSHTGEAGSKKTENTSEFSSGKTSASIPSSSKESSTSPSTSLPSSSLRTTEKTESEKTTSKESTSSAGSKDPSGTASSKSSASTAKTSESSQIPAKVQDLILGKAMAVGPSSITIQKLELSKDIDGKDIVIFTFDWTNGSKETTSSLFYLIFDVLQDGRSLETTFLVDELDISATLESVAPGEEQKNVKAAFILKNKSDLLIELSELFVFTAEAVQVKIALPR